jgi:putative transposase
VQKYKRHYQKNSCYFITLVTRGRALLFERYQNIQLFRTSVSVVKRNYPFTIEAIVILPDHLHFIMSLTNTDKISFRIQQIKYRFTLAYKKHYSISTPISLWQNRFWEHVIRNEKDWMAHINYIHYNPIKHNVAQQIKNYPYSTFRKFVRNGFYDESWGLLEPNDIKHMNLE